MGGGGLPIVYGSLVMFTLSTHVLMNNLNTQAVGLIALGTLAGFYNINNHIGIAYCRCYMAYQSERVVSVKSQHLIISFVGI